MTFNFRIIRLGGPKFEHSVTWFITRLIIKSYSWKPPSTRFWSHSGQKLEVHPLHSYFRRPWKCPENTLVDWWKRIKSLFMKGNCYHVHYLEKMGACTQISMTTIVELKGAKIHCWLKCLGGLSFGCIPSLQSLTGKVQVFYREFPV